MLTENLDLPATEWARGNTQQMGLEGQLINHTSGKGFELSGMRGGAYVRWKPTDSLSGGLRGGREAFWKGKTSKDGFYSGAFGQYAINSHLVVRGDLYYHDALHDFWDGGASVDLQNEMTLWSVGIKRDLMYDSYISLLGIETAEKWAGAARRNTVFVSAKKTWKRAEGFLRVYGGNIVARGVKTNPLYGVDGSYTIGFRQSGWALITKGQFWTLKNDDGGLAGYYSPKSFLQAGLGLSYQRSLSDKNFFTFDLGPAYQSASGSKLNEKSKVGGEASLSVSRQLDENFQIQLQGQHLRLTDVYAQTQGMIWLHRVF
ncbi:MAG: hypothetical protein KF799_03225 [Bdellovibrionales bacterium]|nr:hypothetical protein [Bdellovibrionales bacterium]